MIQHNYDNYFGIKARHNSLPRVVTGDQVEGLSLNGFNPNQVVQTSGYTSYPTITNTTTGQPQAVYGTTPSGTPVTQNNTSGGGTISASADFGTPTQGGDGSGDAGARSRGYADKAAEDLARSLAEEEQYRQSEQYRKEQQLRAEISSAWDAYINDIPNDMQFYNRQGEALTGQAKNFKTENLATLNDSKAQSLRDMQKTARAALQAGNNYLGQLGAGDSSAAGMYSYAINRQQQQQQGELDRFTMTEERKINSEYQNQVFGIQQWLAQQQQALAVAQREGRLQKGLDLASLSKDLLNNALQAAATARQNAESRKTALLQWAADNSLNAGQLQSNLAAIQQPMGQIQTYSAPTSNSTYYSNSLSDEDTFNG